MSFHENFKAARKNCKLTQQELGNLIGVERSAIAHYENGTSMPHMKNIQKICDVLHISMTDLFK